MINYYHILGISQNASQREIKEAYRKLARQYHPDKNPGSTYAEERFKEISQAYHVLRSPAKKANHDHSLAYEAFRKHAGSAPAYHSPASPPPYSFDQRKKYRRGPASPGAGYNYRPAPPVNSRQNMIATAWAFGIFFFLALVVVGLTSYKSYHDEQVREKQNELALEIYQRAEQYFQQEKYEHSLQLLKTIDEQHSQLFDARRLKKDILKKLQEEADLSFEQKDYKKAASSYQLMADYQQGYDALTFAKLVSSYEMISDYPQAIETYKRVIKAEPNTIEARIRLGALFYQLEEYEEALDYYLQASNVVIGEYENIYGKAYALTVNPTRTAHSHYQLHCGLGTTYSKLGMFKNAHTALKWAVFLRPDEAEAYFLMGNNFWTEGRSSEACKKWKEAKQRGSKPAAQKLKKHCQ